MNRTSVWQLPVVVQTQAAILAEIIRQRMSNSVEVLKQFDRICEEYDIPPLTFLRIFRSYRPEEANILDQIRSGLVVWPMKRQEP